MSSSVIMACTHTNLRKILIPRSGDLLHDLARQQGQGFTGGFGGSGGSGSFETPKMYMLYDAVLRKW